VLGIAIADLETMPSEYRVFMHMRKWPWYLAIPRDIILFGIVIAYCGYEESNTPRVLWKSLYCQHGHYCDFFKIVSFNWRLDYDTMMTIYAIAFFILALTSPTVKIVLNSRLI
jgi:hypothetical protein